MGPIDERKLMAHNLCIGPQVTGPYLSLGHTPAAPRNREFDLNQDPSEKMEYGESSQGCGVGEVMGADLTLAPPATTEDIGLCQDHSSFCSNTSHDLQSLDEVSTNMVLPHIQTDAVADGNFIPSRPIAPRSYSQGLYWCEGCKKLTTTSQWHLGPTNIRDLCNKHYQKSLREMKKAAKRAQ